MKMHRPFFCSKVLLMVTFFLWSTLARSQDKSPAEWFCFELNSLNSSAGVIEGKEVPGFEYFEVDEDVHQAYGVLIHGVRFKAILSSIFSSDGNFLIAPEFFPHEGDIMNFRTLRGVPRDSIEYKDPEYAKETFNADAVIIHPFEVEYEPLKKRYNNGKMILIYTEAHEGLLMQLYCLYNDEGREKWDEYYGGIEKMVKFK